MESEPSPAATTTTHQDIDLVYSWVDGSSAQFQAERAKHAATYKEPIGNSDARFASCDELKYSLRSAALHAPWVRKIHIVTNGQMPAWLNVNHPKIQMVSHEQIFTNPDHLPTFSSIAIECHLHRIPGLTERFLYANDDMFFGAAASPNDFYDQFGRMRLGFAPMLINIYAPAMVLLDKIFGNTLRLSEQHQIKPLTRSILTILELQFPRHINHASSTRFRDGKIVEFLHLFLPHYALKVNAAIQRKAFGYGYVDLTEDAGWVTRIEALLLETVSLFCINNSQPQHKAVLIPYLDKMFPKPSSFEL